MADHRPTECFVEYHPRPVTSPTSVASTPSDHLNDRVADVIVSGTAVIRQASGYCEASVVEGVQVESLGSHLNCRREAGVEVEPPDVVDGQPARIESLPCCYLDTR